MIDSEQAEEVSKTAVKIVEAELRLRLQALISDDDRDGIYLLLGRLLKTIHDFDTRTL